MALLPLPVVVELLINGAWTDITQFVYLRNDISITGGDSDKTAKPTPAQATFTVNNGDGRFTPTYTGGAYYPYLTKNTQVRISVQGASSASGNVYSGYRFWGEVPQWPPLQDISGNDVYVDVTANGPLRRIRAGGGRGSALTRYYNQLTGSFTPIAYWPCEEDPDAQIVGAGIDGGTSMVVSTGTPLWKAVSKFNGSAPIGVLNNSTWDGLTGQFGTSGDDIYTAPGTYQWVASTTAVDARVWGGSGGGDWTGLFHGAGGGGGGEFAEEATLAVTPGNSYTVVVGAGGVSGTSSRSAGAGKNSTMTGDSVTVRAHGGSPSSSGTGGAGGTGSSNTVHHNGGAGGSQTGGGSGGGGGGGSGGTAAAGNAGGSTSGSAHGAGGAAVTNGGAGGNGGDGNTGTDAHAGFFPGGGGGGCRGFDNGATGAAGKVELIYTPTSGGTLPTANIIRFIVFVPAHGGNDGKVLLRTITSGTIAKMDCIYQKGAGGGLQLKGFAAGGATLFDSGTVAFGTDNQALMVSCELAKSGANVAWKFKAIQPGSNTIVTSASGTATTAAIGNVTEVIAAPDANITKTAMGHISVQYALIDLTKVSAALHGHHTEMGVDRFIRLANEQVLDNATEFSERTNHWGFRDGTQGWGATNGAVSQSVVFTSSQDADPSGVWSFTVSGTPSFSNYFILTTAQSASVSVDDRVTFSTQTDLTYRVTRLSAPFGGFVNCYFTPDAAAPVANPATAASGAHCLLLTANGGGQPFAFTPSGTSGIPVNPGDIISAACEVFAPTALPAAYISVKTFNAAGTALTETPSADLALVANTETTLKVTATADATAAFFNIHVGDHNADANLTLLYLDNVRVHPRMGAQTRKKYHEFLEEIQDLDQGIMREARQFHGLHYKTRISMFNLNPAVTLNYAAGTLSPPLAPVLDDKLIKNDVTVQRHKGSSVRKTQGGPTPVNTAEPPVGVGRYRKWWKIIAEVDAQLDKLATHLLGLGTVTDERYPAITVDLRRAAITGNALASLMSAVAGVEIGQMIKLTNLPFWYPQATAQGLVTGYSEVLGAYNWQITFATIPYAPYVQVATSGITLW